MIAGRYQPLEPARPGAPQRARDRETAQTVLLREAGPLEPERLAASLRRSQTAQGIFHPSLITLFDVRALAPDRLLLAYEFVAAQSLLQLGGGQPFHPRRAAELMSEIADAVAELHARGITHGGIRGETVLVTLKGKAKLDRLSDPAVAVPDVVTEDTDIDAIVTLLRELTRGAPSAATMLDPIFDGGEGTGSAAALATSLRAASSSRQP
jgi:serine/threonine protein kinase